MRRYQLLFPLDDELLLRGDRRPGWRLGSRVLPRSFTVHVTRYLRFTGDDGHDLATPRELSDSERDALEKDTKLSHLWSVGQSTFELDIESNERQPPRCVALRAPGGIGTPEQRAPIASLVTEACAFVASRDGSFRDFPRGVEYEDMVWEASRARGRRRSRRKITKDRLEEVANVARQYPRTPTRAVQQHLGISRVYARKLIKLADEAGFETVGRQPPAPVPGKEPDSV